MIPAGYLYKTVAQRPEWLGVDSILAIYSISGCVSEDFVDYINYWKHNGYWLFDSPSTMNEIASEANIDLSQCKLFFYEVFELEFSQELKAWREFAPDASFSTNVVMPSDKVLQGFDVATFLCGNTPECSPLSCNSLACEIPVNEYCLFDTFEQAKGAVDAGQFANSERGPLRIFSVYTVGT
jgi:hypothetical protein